MFLKKNIFIAFLLLIVFQTYSQKDSIKVKDVKIVGDINNEKPKREFNPLAPSKAAFYSAIFPGMGQVYNKKYWKTPIVWGALAIPTYYYLTNNSDYKRFRTAYKLRKSGLQDEFITDDGEELLSLETLESAQEQLKENRDLSLLSGVIVYILQIVEASVNAHLLQFETNDNLTFKPTIMPDPIQFDAPVVGLTIKYKF